MIDTLEINEGILKRHITLRRKEIIANLSPEIKKTYLVFTSSSGEFTRKKLFKETFKQLEDILQKKTIDSEADIMPELEKRLPVITKLQHTHSFRIKFEKYDLLIVNESSKFNTF